MVRRRLILVIVLLLLPAMAAGQSYTLSPRLDSLRVNVLLRINEPTSGNLALTTAKLNLAINTANTDVCKAFPAIEKLDTVVVDSTAEGGALNADFDRILEVYRLAGNTRVRLRPLGYVEPVEGDQTVGVSTHDRANLASPDQYRTFARRLLLHPKDSKPAATPDSFLVYYYAMDAQLSAGADSVQIDPKYIPVLLDRACYEIQKMRNNWNDAKEYERAALSRAGFVVGKESEGQK